MGLGAVESLQVQALTVTSPLGNSPAIAQVRRLISQVANHNTLVLIQGESGSGKEVVARALHTSSDRAGKAFIPVNCGAIPADLLESELFGHEKGAFTGAVATRKGRFEMAEGGTLFLDEIGDMSLPMQVKILRVLQERCFERVGSNLTIRCNVRIIVATHRDLDAMVDAGSFRQDLFFRLNVFPIYVPALRQRIEDLPLLLQHFRRRQEANGDQAAEFSQGALQALMHYSWPGNIRELENLVERLGITHGGQLVRVKDLPTRYVGQAADDTEEAKAMLLDKPLLSAISSSIPLPRQEAPTLLAGEGMDLKQYLQDLEVNYINEALRQVGGVVSQAAKLLGLQRTTLVEKMKKFGLQVVW
ncbi:MAG: sigma-54 dependent transcriptional regulator [Pseudomonadota bacterium]